MFHLVTTNAQLFTYLVEKSAALEAANETIRNLRTASHPTGGGTPSMAVLTPNNTRSSNGGTARVHPATNNEH
jgi:hypothetical protein